MESSSMYPTPSAIGSNYVILCREDVPPVVVVESAIPLGDDNVYLLILLMIKIAMKIVRMKRSTSSLRMTLIVVMIIMIFCNIEIRLGGMTVCEV